MKKFTLSAFTALACLVLVGCGDAKVSGRVYVITNARNNVEMAGVTIVAMEEGALRKLVQECNHQLDSEYSKFQKELSDAQAHEKKSGASLKQTEITTSAKATELEAQIANCETQIRAINDATEKQYAATVSAIRSKMDSDPSASFDSNLNLIRRRGSSYVEVCADYLEYAQRKVAEARTGQFYDSATVQREAQAMYQAASKLYAGAKAQYDANQVKTASITATKQRLESELNQVKPASFFSEAPAVATAKMDALQAQTRKLSVGGDWTDRQATVVMSHILGAQSLDALRGVYGKKMTREFQIAKSDMRGTYRFDLPKSGTYAFMAFGERQVFEKTENYLWFKRVTLKTGSSYTVDLNNDNDAQSQFGTSLPEGISSPSSDVLFLYLMRGIYGLREFEL